MQDCVLAYMEENNIEITLANYLELAYLGKPPQQLDGEEYFQIPDEILERTNESLPDLE